MKAKFSENLNAVLFLNIGAIAEHFITCKDVEILCAGGMFSSIEDTVCAGLLISKLKR